MHNKFIILDRDGVINVDSPDYIKSAQEWRPIPGSLEAIAQLTQANFTILITTNQSGVNRDYFSLATLDAIHQKMLNAIEATGGKIAKIYYCPHRPDENCRCRKPKPGMLEQIKTDFDIDFKQTFLVGDSWKDMQLGQSAQCPCILVKTGNGEAVLTEHMNHLQEILVMDDLNHAASFILKKTAKNTKDK